MFQYNFTLPKQEIYTYPATHSNQITKEYYNHLVGEINRGTVRAAVCAITNVVFGVVSYYLISVK